MHMLRTASAHHEGCFLRSEMQMDVQGERQEEKLKRRTGSQGEPPRTPAEIIFSTPSLFFISLCIQVPCMCCHFFPTWLPPSCHLKHQTQAALISDFQVKASFATWFPLTILSLGANIYKLLKWPSVFHLLSLGRMLLAAECRGGCKSHNLQELFVSFVWLW